MRVSRTVTWAASECAPVGHGQTNRFIIPLEPRRVPRRSSVTEPSGSSPGMVRLDPAVDLSAAHLRNSTSADAAWTCHPALGYGASQFRHTRPGSRRLNVHRVPPRLPVGSRHLGLPDRRLTA